MTILVADDHELNRRLVSVLLRGEGYEVLEAVNGIEALALLEAPSGPTIGLIDWEMPGLCGIDVCRQYRSRQPLGVCFLIMLTVRDDMEDIVAGLRSGANDYVRKPFDKAELMARVAIGRKTVELQCRLAEKLRELEQALSEVKQLSGILPICGYCKKIRDDRDYWRRLEDYIARHSNASFSHSICPECYEAKVKPELIEWGIDPTANGM